MNKNFSNIEIHESKPEGFAAKFEAAGHYLEMEGKLLLLQQAAHKNEPGTWGVPGGKLQDHETVENAAIRELFEETGIVLTVSLPHLRSFYLRTVDFDYAFHVFIVQYNQVSHIRLSDEHQDYKWASAQDLEELPLRMGALQVLQRIRSSTV